MFSIKYKVIYSPLGNLRKSSVAAISLQMLPKYGKPSMAVSDVQITTLCVSVYAKVFNECKTNSWIITDKSYL